MYVGMSLNDVKVNFYCEFVDDVLLRIVVGGYNIV